MAKRFLVAVLVFALPVAGTLVLHAQSASGINLAAIDRGANPCDDFYQFACGAWIKNNPIPPGRSSWGVAEQLIEKNNDILKTILESAAAGKDPEDKQI